MIRPAPRTTADDTPPAPPPAAGPGRRPSKPVRRLLAYGQASRTSGGVGVRWARPATLLLLVVLSGIQPAAGSAFTTLETKDFRLIYPGLPLEYIVPYTARCLENSLRFHRELWGVEATERVSVFLDDATDYGNAGVWASPRTGMSVHIAPSNFVYETGPSNERMNFTMNHEMVHVLALDGAAGGDRLCRALFQGKVRETSEHPESIVWAWLCLPRRSAPRWYHEGIATFLETWMAGGLGRAQGPYDEMVFRSMVRDSARFYDPLGLESEGTKVDFQVGANAYLYGTRFFSYLAWEYSPQDLMRWVSRTPGSKRSYARQFRQVFGKSLGEGWSDWVEWERDFQGKNLAAVREHATTPYRDLSSRALGSVSPACFDPDLRTLYVGVQYPGTVAHLAALDIDGGELRQLREVKGPALYFVCALARDPGEGTLFYTSDNNEWRDLWACDPRTGRATRLIKDARIGDLAFNRADRTLWGVRHLNGYSTIVRLQEPYREWNQIVTLPYGRDLYDIDISPDGSLLAGSMAEIGGRQSLRLFPLGALAAGDTASRSLFDFGSAIPEGFVFSPDGRRLYGSSYYTGVSNIFRYDLDLDSIDVVTNAETGFFRPIPLGGDSLIVFRYGGAGFVPAAVEAKPIEDVSAITFLGAELVEKHPVLKTWKAPPPSSVELEPLIVRQGDYRSIRSIGLASVYPIFEGYKDHGSPGIRIDLSDPMQMHRVDLSVSHTPQKTIPADERWHARLAYRRWSTSYQLRWNPASFYDLVGPFKSSRKGVGASVGWERTLVRDAPREMNLSAGVDGWGGLQRLPQNQNVETSAGFDKLLAGHAELSYKNLRASIGAVDHEKGHSWKVIAALNGVRFEKGGHAAWRGFPQGVGALDGGIPGPVKNASVWIRTAAGYSPGEREEPFANFFFGGFGNNRLDRQDPKRYRDWASFPGTEIDGAAGTNFTRAMLDLNLPPLRFRRLGVLPFFAAWTRLSLFGTALATNLDDAASRRKILNSGAQADTRIQFLIQHPLTFSVGYARAYERHRRATDEWMVSLKIL